MGKGWVVTFCRVFCCPPWPAKIVSKLAFAPPEPSYSFQTEEVESLDTTRSYVVVLKEDADWGFQESDTYKLEGVLGISRKGNRIACIFVKCVEKPKFVILYSHGNAVDIGRMSSFYLSLGLRLNCNVFSYDYSGYGISTGKPSEKNLYADIDLAWNVLLTRYGVRPERVILYGQSIGSVPTVDLASRQQVAAVVIHSGLMSAMRVLYPHSNQKFCIDAFPNNKKIPNISSPVLVIHGVKDSIIDICHGVSMYEMSPDSLEPLWVKDAGHNDIELHHQYIRRLKKLVREDLPRKPREAPAIAPENTGESSKEGNRTKALVRVEDHLCEPLDDPNSLCALLDHHHLKLKLIRDT